jgi:hypothetical protein
MPDDIDHLAARLSVELIRLGFARARMTREPWRAVMPISAAHGVLLAAQQRELIAEAHRSGRGYSWRGDRPPARDKVVWLRPSLGLDVALRARCADISRERPRSRESRPHGRRVRSAAAPRDGPLPSDDDDDPAPPPGEGAA